MKLSIVPDKRAYWPGDIVGLVVEVITEPVLGAAQAAATQLASLELECSGTERVDLTWADATVLERDARRVTRRIFRGRPVRVLGPCSLLPDSRQMFLVRLQLPHALPPTFRGSGVATAFQVEARATFAAGPSLWGASLATLPAHQPLSFLHVSPGPGYGSQSSAMAQPSEGSAVSGSQEGAAASEQGGPQVQGAGRQQANGVGGGGRRPASLHQAPHLRYAGGLLRSSTSRDSSHLQQQLQRKGTGVVSVRTPIHVWPDSRLARTDSGPDRRMSSLSTAAPAEDAEQAVQSYQLNQQDLDLYIDCLDLVRNQMVDVNGANSEAPGGPKGSSRLQRGGSLQKAGATRKLRLSGTSLISEITPVPSTADISAVEPAPSPAASQPQAAEDGDQTPASRARLSRQTTADSERMSLLSPHAGDTALLRSYNLKVGDQPLVRVALHPPLEGQLQLGSTIAGTLDLRASHEAAGAGTGAPNCVQIIITLETEEVVHECWQAAARKSSGTAVMRKVYDEHQELTPDTILTHFLFSLPVDAPPSFATQLVSLRWVLRFEFTAAHQSSSSWLGSRKPDQVSWMLPIHVHVPC
eukprot:jgi/Astpho2/5253/Aster-x1285